MKQARQDYRAEVAALSVGGLHFIDESGMNLGLTRRYGRAAPGVRVEDAVPFNPGPNVSVIGALSCRGIGAVMSIEGATDGPVFLAYVREVLAPTLAEGDVAVMDNLSAHKVAGVREGGQAPLSLALLARFLADRALLVENQDHLARRQSPPPRSLG